MTVKNRAKNKVLKKLLLDTMYGDRSFLLIQGDLMQDEGDVIIITIHDQDSNLQGELFESVKEKFGIGKWEEKLIYNLDDHGWIGKVVYDHLDGGHNPVILTMHTGLPEGTTFEIEAYEKYVKGTFAALAALEFDGSKFRELSLPVLIRKGLENNYEEAIQCLIKHATNWLKSSKNGETIKYYIYQPQDAIKWEESMEAVLSRTYISYSKSGIINQLRKEIIKQIDTYKKDKFLWEEVLIDLRSSLATEKDEISSTTKIAGRKLAEVIVKSICNKHNIPNDSDLAAMIAKLKNTNIIPDLAAQYLHSLRIYGNKKAHIDNSEKIEHPIKKLFEEDGIILLSTILRTLLYYSGILRK